MARTHHEIQAWINMDLNAHIEMQGTLLAISTLSDTTMAGSFSGLI